MYSVDNIPYHFVISKCLLLLFTCCHCCVETETYKECKQDSRMVMHWRRNGGGAPPKKSSAILIIETGCGFTAHV